MKTLKDNLSKVARKDFLYKHYAFNENTLKIFENKEIYVPTFEKFNDPFEGLCELKTKFWDDKELSKKALPGIRDAYNDPIHQEFFHTFHTLRSMSELIGVLCLTEDFDNELLWSHYSDSHKGFCLEFKNEQELSNIVRTRKVIYQNQRHIQLDFCSRNVLRSYEKLVFTKGKIWDYEKEWRIVYDIGNKTYPFPGKLTKVIFGCKTEDLNIKFVMNKFGDSVKYKKMEIVKDKFKLKSINLNMNDYIK